MGAMTPVEKLIDQLSILIGKIREEDLEDPEIAGLMGQLVCTLKTYAQPFPAELIDKISQIPDNIERFKQAAVAVNAESPEELKTLVDSMRAEGLFKKEDQDLAKAKKADLVTFSSDVAGAVCRNCKYVDIEKSYCNHKDVAQSLKDGPDRMCCSYWDHQGTKREWESSDTKNESN